ncbi:DUF1934 domain-containing protein [Thermoanaerobacterium sp. RBIITD]|uniref:DUF1934 domain-containing protein n=1 Tax=Thermoanaerobacterium sp. RBIITD TaxID=1550240 RepID=UPI000BB87C6A|nr:DUF1934 domain-containing protein [Thermoanaerobacterium sp. RBIITD]SNX53954.1 Uncharacterized beta-barrel protein YwiB, DUF1934 family [Thermoanaerobacterium sp. RBIITD]
MRKAVITVKGTQKNAQNELDTIELITEGGFLRKGDYYYIKYDESEISGMDGTTTTLKISEDVVVLMRFGSNQSKMVFEKDKRHESNYVTPYGNVLLGIKPHVIDVKLNENGGELKLKYALDLNENVISDNELHLTVREVN